jgi:hypothetical protein
MSEFISVCPKCRQRILCDTAYVGQRIACPMCLQEITMPEASLGNQAPPTTGGKSVPEPPPSATPVAGKNQKPLLLAIAGGVVALMLVAGAVAFIVQKKAPTASDSQAEFNSKIAQAASLASNGKLDQADILLAEVKNHPIPASKENADMLRKLGEWHALAGRWQLASDRYLALITIDAFDTWDTVTLDYQACGTVLVEAGNRDRYNQFCLEACASAVANSHGDAAQRVMKSCLLLPANNQLIGAMTPLSKQAESFTIKKEWNVWFSIPMGLWKYRCDDYSQANYWCQRGISVPPPPPCNVAVRSILAMSLFRQHRTTEARQELAQAKGIFDNNVKNGIPIGDNSSGKWYDWVFARILLREAQAMITPSSAK